MDLKKHYENLYRASLKKIRSGEYTPDHLIDSPRDNRLGITLLLRPSAAVKERISLFLREMEKAAPGQYFYPESDMHNTVMSIISCYDGFDLSQIIIDDYVDVLDRALSGAGPFNIAFKGITASPDCVMIQGFPEDVALNRIRDPVRTAFRESALRHSIDTRYELKTAHSTVIRLRKELDDTREYIRALDAFRDFNFGTFTVDSLELVYNDWYQRAERCELLHRFALSQWKP